VDDHPASRTRTMAVDDDPTVRDIYRRVLTPPAAEGPAGPALVDLEARLFGKPETPEPTHPEFDLTVCSQGDEAVEAVQLSVVEDRTYAVVFLDVRMPPGPDGVWTAEQIRALDPRAEIVIVTGYSDVPPDEICRRAPPAGQLLYLQKPFTPHEITQLASALGDKWRTREVESRRAHEEIVLRLAAAAEARDSETGTHLRRIGAYAALLARACGWSADRAEQIRIASILHDAGKIGVPDEVLQKPGALTDGELLVMRTHSEIGSQLLGGSDLPVLQMAEEIALAHHEWWDGSGYPRGLSSEQIPESARLVAIVDVYDALVHNRVYRPAFSQDVALAMMREGRGRQFDPRLLDRFLELLPRFEALRERLEKGSAAPASLVAVAG